MREFFNTVRQWQQRIWNPSQENPAQAESPASQESDRSQEAQLSQLAVSQGESMERKITLTQAENKITVAVTNAQSVEVLNASGQMVERKSSDRILSPQIFHLEAGEYQVVTDGQITDITTEAGQTSIVPEFYQLALSSDAKDFHVVDGIGEIPADGQSFTTITIRKLNSSGTPLQEDAHNDEIFLRTNAGFIKDTQGNQEIRSVRLNRGQATFRLYSENHKRLATVQTVSANAFLADTSISIEFF
jgi:hypothetical protein